MSATGGTGAPDQIERLLATIWSEVLLRAEIGPTDDFFALGGHSLLAMRVLHRLREQTGVKVPVRVFFDAPVLRDLARAVAGRMRDAGLDGAAVAGREHA